MGIKVSVDAAVRFTKLSVYLAHSWPPTRIDTKFKRIKLEVVWFMSVLSCLGLLIPLLISIFNQKSTSLVRIQSACFVGAICNYIVKMIVYRVQRRCTQILINEMEDFLKTAEPHERILLQRYVNRILVFHAVITIVNYTTTIIVICGPLFLPQQLPTDAVYPFSLDSPLAKYIVYLHQSFVGFQCSTGATIDCQTALMMWFAGARLELLSHELRKVKDVDGFYDFVRKHQRLLWYASEVSQTTSYIALTTSIMCGFGTIFSGLQLLSCHMMGAAVYDASWTNMSSRMMKNYLMILRRSQKAVIVSIGGFIPTLSLGSYTSYLSTAFSYTTTLRLVVTAG